MMTEFGPPDRPNLQPVVGSSIDDTISKIGSDFVNHAWRRDYTDEIGQVVDSLITDAGVEAIDHENPAFIAGVVFAFNTVRAALMANHARLDAHDYARPDY